MDTDTVQCSTHEYTLPLIIKVEVPITATTPTTPPTNTTSFVKLGVWKNEGLWNTIGKWRQRVYVKRNSDHRLGVISTTCKVDSKVLKLSCKWSWVAQIFS